MREKFYGSQVVKMSHNICAAQHIASKYYLIYCILNNSTRFKNYISVVFKNDFVQI
jgi:hypothetical protein